MRKEVIDRFIDKYRLSGNVNSVKLTSKGDILHTRFITDDKSLLGEMTMKNFTFDEAEMGVYNTEQLTKLLSVLDADIDVKLNKIDDKAVSLKISDSNASINFMLSDLNVINQPPNLKTLPDFECKIKIDSKFMETFIKGKNALAEVDTFTVVNNRGSMELVIGYSTMNTNRVTIPVSCTGTLNDHVSFSAKYFKDVLVANKECGSATLEVSSKGLSRINFKVDDYDVTYFMVAIDEVD
jgi:hypothetical protein|tara:strand:- start:413 stop:1129 length:717 start_codon:yes stop_codon:yes gene_type:complete